MTRNDLSTEAYSTLLEAIMPIILRNGLKATTMDLVASSLSMSKRTLYEIFDSKQNMIEQVLGHVFKRSEEQYSRIFREEPDVMTAMLRVFAHQRDIMSEVILSRRRAPATRTRTIAATVSLWRCSALAWSRASSVPM